MTFDDAAEPPAPDPPLPPVADAPPAPALVVPPVPAFAAAPDDPPEPADEAPAAPDEPPVPALEAFPPLEEAPQAVSAPATTDAIATKIRMSEDELMVSLRSKLRVLFGKTRGPAGRLTVADDVGILSTV
jgi:hypothetical protein